MDSAIIEKLTRLTREEQDILEGKALQRGNYSYSERFIVNSAKFLEGKELDLRLHTRFVDFPEHRHDYLEFMYVYAGRISHVIGKETVTLERGDIIFLNRHARHSIKRAGQEDIGINFIVSDALLRVIFRRVSNNPVMSGFLSGNFDDGGEAEYLFFRTQNNFPIRNLMDNLIYGVVNGTQEVYAGLVELLFSYLAYYRETLVNTLRVSSPDTKLRRAVAGYFERSYPAATLSALSAELGYTEAYLSRRIRELFGKPFRLLLQEYRLRAAEELLCTSRLPVEEIVRAVGYENTSHFYRAFQDLFGETPHKYRKNHASPAPS